MKQHPNPRRGRNRGNGGKRHVPIRSQTFESNGPDGKIRGTAQQVLDRYLALGRDAYSAGDPITAESYYQHAEHYYRILHIEGGEADRARARAAQGATEGGGEDGAVGASADAPTGEDTVGRLPV